MQILDESLWRERAASHAERIDALLGDAVERRRAGVKHPVQDFLFEYYSFRPGRLRQWHPGFGVVLAGDADDYLNRRGYVRTDDGITVGTAEVERLGPVIEGVLGLSAAIAHRPAQFGCFGLHEWAMVHETDPDATRHPAWPLRRSAQEIASTISEIGLRCTHFDAFRFYAPNATGLNLHELTAANRAAFEQGGCLHANMDIYKWAYKLVPLVPSELVADTFDLASRIREVDMRAAPYELRALGYEPIHVDTSGGRAEFTRLQRSFAGEARVLRSQLLGHAAALSGNPVDH